MKDFATASLLAAEAARGVNIIAGSERTGSGEAFWARDPRNDKQVGPEFHTTGETEVAEAVTAARKAFDGSGGIAPLEALRAAADLLDEHAVSLVAQAMQETGLTEARLSGEIQRTSGQLRFMAEIAGRGERLDATIDLGDPEVGRPDVRRVGVPIGPVAVFGASNFPFAFSVLGGDTASALAAGCPVVVKAHESHPGTSELCGRLMVQALAASGCEQGWFSLLQGRSHALGHALATEPGIQAVAFTGSLQGGRSLFDAASHRPDPIPVYAEMGSLNPIFVTAASAARRGDAIAAALATALTGSAGQLCTKPNLVVLPAGADGEHLEGALAQAFAVSPLHPLLNQGVRDGLVRGMHAASSLPDVSQLCVQSGPPDAEPVALGGPTEDSRCTVAGTLLSASLESLLTHGELWSEHFGPAGVVVRCPEERFVDIAERLEGSLTATVQLEPEAAGTWTELVGVLTAKVGRVIVNGVPTGVAVVRAMHHGGPYPATTSARDTSVGAAAIDRFLRQVCFQGFPDSLLPPALQDSNPLGIWRRVDGELTGTRAPRM